MYSPQIHEPRALNIHNYIHIQVNESTINALGMFFDSRGSTKKRDPSQCFKGDEGNTIKRSGAKSRYSPLRKGGG